MFSFHKPKVYRSPSGCCICKAKSSSSRFTDSKKYEEDFVDCFQLEERRAGEVCNACVLLVKRWKKLPPGSQRHWRHVVDARAGPGTKSFVKIKSKKNGKHKSRSKKIVEEEELEDDSKKVINNDENNDFEMNNLSGENEPFSDPPSPRSANEEDEPIELCIRSHKRINTAPPVSSFLDMTYWKREKVCCGIIFKGPNGQVIVDQRFMKPCMFKRANKVAVSKPSENKVYSDNSSDSGYDESSNPGEAGQSNTIDYIDVDYSLWVTWLLLPLVISFLLPLIIVLLLYVNATVLYIYKLHRYRLRNAFETDRPLYNGALNFLAAMWDAHGYIWHGYEIRGVENIPDKTPALFIFYHGAIPIDVYYFMSRVFLLNNRIVHTVADRFLFKIPGFAIVAEALKVVPGTVQSCSTILNSNNLLAISPGGVYESQFSDSHYQLMWKKRLGFAKVALEARVPIIPMFTRNVRESFRTVGIFRRFWLKLYSWTKFPLVPIYGGFPVKLITFVGTPIPYDSSLSPEDLAGKVSSALEELIAKNQRLPGSIVRALLERFYEPANSIKHK